MLLLNLVICILINMLSTLVLESYYHGYYLTMNYGNLIKFDSAQLHFLEFLIHFKISASSVSSFDDHRNYRNNSGFRSFTFVSFDKLRFNDALIAPNSK